MIQIDEENLANLPTSNQLHDDKYGPDGTPEREEFNAKAIAWYYDSFSYNNFWNIEKKL